MLMAGLALPVVLCAGNTPDEWFPVLAWGSTAWSAPEGRATVQEDFDLMKECGITIAGFSLPEQLDMVAKAGLKTYFYAPAVQLVNFHEPDYDSFPQIVAEAVAQCKDRPEVIGIYLCDEPRVQGLPAVAALRREMQKQAPELVPYINLFPNTLSEKSLGGTYDEYLDKYIEYCDMPYISYDLYSLPEDRFAPLSENYWLNMEQVRAKALEKGIDFHFCTLGVSHFNYRQPTLDDMHFQVWSALLYGAKGLALYTYFTPPLGNYREAPINEYGDRTQLWYDLRKVLKGVHNRAAILNKLESRAVYHIPVIEREKGTRGPDGNSLLTGVSDGDGARFAVGEFVHTETGETYIIILNKDLNNSYPVNLKWQGKEPAKVEINPASRKGEWHDFAGEEKWIAPGHAHLLKVTF